MQGSAKIRITLLSALVLLLRLDGAFAQTASSPFVIADRGGVSFQTAGTDPFLSVGYGSIQPDTAQTTPSGAAIFGFRENNVLVSETSVPAAAPLSSGRIYAEIAGPLNTGIAIVNPNNLAVAIDFYFTDISGNPAGSGSMTVPGNQHVALFLDQPPLKVYTTPAFQGTFSFTATAPVAAIALRGFTNERGEFLTSTLPVIDTSLPPTRALLFLPHFAAGGGWTTQILLVNPGEETVTGSVTLNPNGMAAGVDVIFAGAGNFPCMNRPSCDFTYAIPGRTAQKITIAGGSTAATGSITIGSIIGATSSVSPIYGPAPAPLAVLSYRPAGVTVAEAGVVPVIRSDKFRMYAESSGKPGQPGSVQTGIAVAGTAIGDEATVRPPTVVFELTDLTGAPIAGLGPASISLETSRQSAIFLDQLFPELPPAFKGIVRISSSTLPIAVMGLRTRINERGDFLFTATPLANERSPSTTTPMLFPQIVDGGGYSTQFILFNGVAGQTTLGNLQFLKIDGTPMKLTLK